MGGVSRVGYLAVSGAGVLWGFGGTFARYLIDRGASVVELTEARAWVTLAGVGLVLALRRRERPVTREPSRWTAARGAARLRDRERLPGRRGSSSVGVRRRSLIQRSSRVC